ncbi:MAG: alkaline phosphatase PafA [Candidatus Saccharimonadaceae bacterium]
MQLFLFRLVLNTDRENIPLNYYYIMKFYTLLLMVFLFSVQGYSQKPNNEKAKLVVGIVVDQMRNDYIDRFWNRYSDDGFKRLVNQGYRFKNGHFNYVPTYTGPGHASVFTGTSPMNHGIIGNNWYDKTIGESVYCAGDSNVVSVGTSDITGMMSPHRLIATTITDENRLATQMRGKTIGIALKDRGAILPAGHTANAAYWFHGKDEGRWITSSYYLNTLPNWVVEFNKSGKAASYFKTWNTLYPIETYVESGSDLNKFEGGFKGKETATFPYDLQKLKADNNNFEILRSVAFGNDLTTDFAMAAINGENLGKDDDTDFLTLSYSSTDYVGHNFGVNSKEIEDTYLRLDKNIADLLQFLDQKVGKDNYIVFLTADHAAGDVPAYLDSLKIPAGYFESKDFKTKVDSFVEKEFGDKKLIQDISNDQLFFNYQLLEEMNIKLDEFQQKLARFILAQDNIHRVYTREQIVNGAYTVGMDALIKNGFNHKRSGDLIYILAPSFSSYSHTGSTHGSSYVYDTHVPMLFYGKGVKNGSTSRRSEIVDIAPTIAIMLGISFPSATTGEPLFRMLEE